MTSATGRALDLLPRVDRSFDKAMAAALGADTFRIEGDLAPIAAALSQPHDEIITQTV